jgi:two-component system NtrC family response regulator
MVSKSPDTTVLLMAESGTGKELITKAIYDSNSRKNNRVMVINCTVIVQNIIERK